MRFPTEDGLVHAGREHELRLARQRDAGIVGESGSGKCVTSMAILGPAAQDAPEITGSLPLPRPRADRPAREAVAADCAARRSR